MNTKNDTIVMIAGKGGTAFDKTDILSATLGLKKHYPNFVVIGNGEDDISLEQIKKRLKERDVNKFDLCILAHGEQKDDGFHFMLNDDNGISSADFFKTISEATKNPVNVHIFSCHGGGALKDINYLPDGSKAFSCCDGRSVLPETDVQRYFHKLSNMNLDNTDLDTIMNVYLASMENRNAVLMIEKNKTPVNLLNLMLESTGRPLQDSEKKLITETFSSFFAKEILDAVIQKYAQKGEYNMYAKEIGCAMAIAQLLNKTNNAKQHNRDINASAISHQNQIDR